MAKTSENKVETAVGNKVGAPVAEKADAEMVSIVFRENRTFDLHVGRKMVTFGPRERKEIPKAWLKHPDFQQVAGYFVVKGF